MSQATDVAEYRQKGIEDYLDRASMLLYGLATVLFVGGLWYDWQNPGHIVISQLVFTDEPYPNSGLFIAAVIILFLGFVISRVSNAIENYRREEAEDQTQEWVVDIGNR